MRELKHHHRRLLTGDATIHNSRCEWVNMADFHRRLAAILSADVVGYSRLMRADEVDTFERIRAHRKEVFEPQITRHKGRIFKLMGDGLLAEFDSVVDAVRCAAELQLVMLRRNALFPMSGVLTCVLVSIW